MTQLIALFRVVLSAAMGGILGLERTRKLRPAGLRTYMLICIGSCVSMMIGLMLSEQNGGATDPTRIAAQVVSGIGFIGAGTIMVTHRHQVKGLTTAAGLWATASLGMVIGCGLYWVALGVFAVIFATMVLADKLELMVYTKLKRLNLSIIVATLEDIKRTVLAMEAQGIFLTSVDITDSLQGTAIVFSCVARMQKRTQHDEVISILRKSDGVLFVERTGI